MTLNQYDNSYFTLFSFGPTTTLCFYKIEESINNKGISSSINTCSNEGNELPIWAIVVLVSIIAIMIAQTVIFLIYFFRKKKKN